MVILKKNKLIFFLAALLVVAVGGTVSFILPGRFFYDALTIKNQLVKPGWSGSYEITTLFYNTVKLSSLPFFVVGLIQLPILMFILYRIGIPENFYKASAKNILVYLSLFIMAIYTSMPSKEFITFLYLSIIIFIFKSHKISYAWQIILSMLLLFFFAFFRPYYMLIPCIAIGMYLFTYLKVKNKAVLTVLAGIGIAILLSWFFYILSGEYLTASKREELNSFRVGADASHTIIQSPVTADTWYGEFISIIYGFISVNFPINGFKFILSPQIIAFVLWQLLMFYVLLVRLSWALQDKVKYRTMLWVLLIVFGYFIVQGIFEPDLGSAVKHKMGVLPLIYYALYYENSGPEVQESV